MFCKNCGNNLPDGTVQCPYCGLQMVAPAAQPAQPAAQPVVEIKSHLVAAILTTLFCCLPFGIVSIVYAAKVSDLVAAGRYDEAMKASESAKTWALVSFLIGLVFELGYFILMFFGALASN